MSTSWQKVTYLFAGRNVPVLIDRVVLGKTTSGTSPGIFLDNVKLLE